jgi:hypothetical protein
MKQIYHCTLFLRSYGEKGFVGKCLVNNIGMHFTDVFLILVRTLRHSFTVKTDDAIQKFTDAFTNLKQCFHQRLDVDSWKIACTMKEGVLRLVATTDQLKEIGKIRITVVLLHLSLMPEAQLKMSVSRASLELSSVVSNGTLIKPVYLEQGNRFLRISLIGYTIRIRRELCGCLVQLALGNLALPTVLPNRWMPWAASGLLFDLTEML